MKPYFFRVTLAFCAVLFSLTAQAMINVTPVIVDLDSNDVSATQSQDIRVSNQGEQVAYVKVTPLLVVSPGTKQEQLKDIKNPEDLGLLVSPRKLMIPPGQFKLVRLVFTKKPDQVDRVFRVNVQPVSGSLLFPKAAKEEVGIKLLVGYAVLVMQRPINATPKISIERNGRVVTIKNAGNTNAILVEGRQCDSQDKCAELQTQRLYAGNTWQFTAPAALPVTFKGYFGDHYLNVKSN